MGFVTRIIVVVGFLLAAIAGGHSAHARAGALSSSVSEAGAHHHAQSSALSHEHRDAGMHGVICPKDDDRPSGSADCCAAGCNALQFTVDVQTDGPRVDPATPFQWPATTRTGLHPDLLHRPPEA